jgi:hypothetical protein
LSLERNLRYLSVVEMRVHRQLVAAKRVVPGTGEFRAGKLALVSRILVVIEDHFLVKIV